MDNTNSERQARWRARLRQRGEALTGSPDEIADNILRVLQLPQARQVTEALAKRAGVNNRATMGQAGVNNGAGAGASQELEAAREEIARLKAQLSAVSNGRGSSYAAPFPEVISGDAFEDGIALKEIVPWFEDRIIDGKLSPNLLGMLARGLNHLGEAYWSHRGYAKPRKRLTNEQKHAVIAARKHKHENPPPKLTPDQKLERIMAEKLKDQQSRKTPATP